MAELGFVSGGGAGIHRGWLKWDLVVRELATGFIGNAKVEIVGGYGGEICPWLPSWDLLASTEQGLSSGRGDGICWQSQTWYCWRARR